LAILVCPSWEKPVRPLQNIPDCYALEESFSDLGWSTLALTGPDAQTKKIMDTISETRIRHLVFYFGGHGVVYNCKNILVTAGAGPSNIGEGLALDTLIELVRRKATTATLYLDACRTEFLPLAATRNLGMETEAGFMIPDNRAMNEKFENANVNVFFGSSDRKPTYDHPDGSGGIFSGALKAALDSAQARDIYLTRIAGDVVQRVSSWVGPNSERQKPVLVLGTETLVGERLPKRKRPSAPSIELIPGIESPAQYEGFNNKMRLIVARPRRDLPEVHVYDALKDSEPGEVTTPIGYFKAPITAGKDSTTYAGEFAVDGNAPVPARLLFDGARIEIALETQVTVTPPTAVLARSCLSEPVMAKRRFGKAKPADAVREKYVEQTPVPTQEPRQDTTMLKFFDRKSLVH
jgi:hypothetical protein